MTASPLSLSYCGTPPLPDEIWWRWNVDPWLLLALAAATALVLRASKASQHWGLLGIGVLAVAFVSPLCALTNALFAARTVHHLLLVAVAAPLIAAAWPTRDGDRRSAHLPLAVSSAVFWAWHWPAAYSAALASVAVYWAMQFSLLLTAVWFWRRVLDPSAELTGRLISIVAAMAQMGLLGAILTFAPRELYAEHAVARLYGLTQLEDQQLAGLLMWVPAMVPYFVVAALVTHRAWSRALAPA